MEKLGLQLYSVKEAAEADLLGTLKKVAAMGYKAVEFAGFYSHPAADVKATLDEVGLAVAGAHVPIEELTGDIDALLAYHREIGNELIICPWLPENMRTTAKDYQETAQLFNDIGKKLADAGFMFGYHNHAFEFEMVGEQCGFHMLFENTDPKYVKMELDCFWAVQAGHTPEQIMERYNDRLVSLHLKDLVIENGDAVSTEIGHGVISMRDLIDAGEANHAKWYIVEQENFKQDPLESARENAAFLLDLV